MQLEIPGIHGKLTVDGIDTALLRGWEVRNLNCPARLQSFDKKDARVRQNPYPSLSLPHTSLHRAMQTITF